MCSSLRVRQNRTKLITARPRSLPVDDSNSCKNVTRRTLHEPGPRNPMLKNQHKNLAQNGHAHVLTVILICTRNGNYFGPFAGLVASLHAPPNPGNVFQFECRYGMAEARFTQEASCAASRTSARAASHLASQRPQDSFTSVATANASFQFLARSCSVVPSRCPNCLVRERNARRTSGRCVKRASTRGNLE